MNPEIIVPILIAFIASLPGLWAIMAQRKQTDATASSTLVDAALDIVKENKDRYDNLVFEVNEVQATAKLYNGRISELEKETHILNGKIQTYEGEIKSLRREVEVLRVRVREYREGILALIRQIEALGHTPAYKLRTGDE
jgi:chromosome segregation ATPase